jgi:hypothetical protein
MQYLIVAPNCRLVKADLSVMGTVTKSVTSTFQHYDPVTLNTQVHRHNFRDKMQYLNLVFVITMTSCDLLSMHRHEYLELYPPRVITMTL